MTSESTLSLRHAFCSGGTRLLACLFIVCSSKLAHAQFSTTINVPPDPAPNAIGSNTQLNLLDGAMLPSSPHAHFHVGLSGEINSNVELNIHGGIVEYVDANFGSVVNITGGTVVNARANAGSHVNISGGTISAAFIAHEGSTASVSGGTFGFFFLLEDGSRAEISGGTFFGSEFAALAGSELTISGGTILGNADFRAGSQTTISGGEFLVNGIPPQDSTVSLSRDNVLTGTLEDGTAFIYSFGDVMLANAAIPDLDLTPLVVDSTNAPAGLRRGQSLTLTTGGALRDGFAAVDATLNIAGGETGQGLRAAGSRVTVSGGSLGDIFFAAHGSQVLISGGTVGRDFSAGTDSKVIVTGGLIGNGFDAHSGSHVVISGGSFGPTFRADGGSIDLYGTLFSATNADFSQHQLGERLTVSTRDGRLDGLLADGSLFSLDLDRRSFSTQAELTVTLVSLLEGDYNSNGTVEQADLDLVLTGWGDELFNPFAAGWINDLPKGAIDQEELDRVLIGWGDSAAPAVAAAAGVPEPSGFVLGLTALTALLASLRRPSVDRA